MENINRSDINEIGATIKAGLAVLTPANEIAAIALGTEFSDGGHALLLRSLFNSGVEVLLIVDLGGEVFGHLWDGHHYRWPRMDTRLRGTCKAAFDGGCQLL